MLYYWVGKLNGNDCAYFVDSGASGNFVSREFVRKTGLEKECSSLPNPLIVKLADGSEHSTSTVLKGARFGGVSGPDSVLYGTHDLPVIPLDGYEVILGRPWLKAVNPVINWEYGTVEARQFVNS